MHQHVVKLVGDAMGKHCESAQPDTLVHAGAHILRLDEDIETLQLAPISYTIRRVEKWTIDRVDRVEREYRTYLQAVRLAGFEQEVAPSLDVDTYWHHHILDTSKYMRDCENLFGRYLHHYPYSGIFGETDATAQRERVLMTFTLTQAYLPAVADTVGLSRCTPHPGDPGGPPACSPGPHCQANNVGDLHRRPTRTDMMMLHSAVTEGGLE